MRIHPRLAAGAAVLLVHCMLAAQTAELAPELAIPPALLRPLDAVAQELLKNGRIDDAREVQVVLDGLGYDGKALAKLKAAIAAARPGKPKEPADKLAGELRKAARGLAAQLGKLEGPARTALAGLLLRLDGEVAEAHTALGREHVGSEWLDETGRACRARRPEIDAALLAARRLQFPIEARETEHPLFTALGVAKVTELKLGAMTVVSEWPPLKSRRALLSAAQACAFSRWLLTGEMSFEPRACRYLHFAQRTLYEKSLPLMVQSGVLDAGELEQVKPLHTWNGKDSVRIAQDITEAAFQTALLYDDSFYRLPQAWLLAGHVDWIARSMFGSPLGLYTFEEIAGGRHTVAGGKDKERERMERLGRAGLAGARAWMRWLAERRQETAWANAFVDEVGKIPAEAVLKCTFVHEYLAERSLLAAVARAPKEPVAFRAAVAAATAAGYDIFDEAWRQWLLSGSGPGLADRIAGVVEPALSEDERTALAHLDAVRKLALATRRYGEPDPPTVELDRTLSAGARLHALYLQQNPAQMAAWPDAHEEYADHPGFTAAGAFAGAHSVIAGAATTRAAIDAWLSTFYHRLPLLDPGLMRTGFAVEHGIAVLDAGSMCMPTNSTYLIAQWPAPNQKDVPLHFGPEMPNPVPGEDQGQWGFPVTFQHCLAPPYDPAAVVMTLHSGERNGPAVDCWFSSPVHPTNPEMSPADAYCLIPKAALQPKTLYTVVVVLPQREGLVWSFHTQ
ncbi:MAG TPA: CAP domain-containing protein [Planctomycetota bacterium]|nr:CAP domain-containing protein [Planctomycetota bacterium]